MKLLAIDTTSKVAGVALMEDETIVYEANAAIGLTHSQTMMPMVQAALELTGWRAEDIDCYAAVAGPGSFTGVRIGICAVKAMAQAVGKPVAAVGTLDVLAEAAACRGMLTVPMLDARREQVYTAAFLRTDKLHPVIKASAMSVDELAEKLKAYSMPIMVCGDGALANREKLQQLIPDVQFAPKWCMLQRAGAAAHLAQKEYAAGRLLTAAQLEPFYLRKPQAEREYEARNAK